MALAALLTACRENSTNRDGITESWDSNDTVQSRNLHYHGGVAPVIAGGRGSSQTSAGQSSGSAVHSVSSRGGFGYSGHFSSGS